MQREEQPTFEQIIGMISSVATRANGKVRRIYKVQGSFADYFTPRAAQGAARCIFARQLASTPNK